MATAKQVIDVAVSQIGVAESPPGSNNVKYNTEYYGHAVSGSAYPWCMVFVWWVFRQAGASELFYDGGRCAGCTTFMRWAKKTGRWHTSGYKPGDIVLYQFNTDSYADHTGIVERVGTASVTAIEGNTSTGGSQTNGGEVLRKTRTLSLVMGAYRPDYDSEPGPEPDDPVDPGEDEMTYTDFLKMYRKALDETDPFYAGLDDVPEYWREDVRKLVKAGAIVGDGVDAIAKRRSQIEAMVPLVRYVDDMARDAK